MKNTKHCPKCGTQNIVRVPDDAHRYLANSICITKFAVVKRIPIQQITLDVIRLTAYNDTNKQ